MVRYVSVFAAVVALAAGSMFSFRALGADDKTTTTAPAATLACCGDACKKMSNCCKADDKGKVTCSMGGSCCVKADDKGNAK